MTDKLIEDFEREGFSIYEDGEKPKAEKAQASSETKIVVIDTKEVLHAVNHTNIIVKQGIENSNLQLQTILAKLINAMDKKPESFTLDIKRDQRGFMTSVDVKINK